MSAFFVTATGTELGKTYVTAALIASLRAQGRPAAALKPVLSGFDPTHPEDSDSGILLRAMGQAVTAAALDAITPWRFAAPLSPDRAAAREGRTLDLAAVTGFCGAAIAAMPPDGMLFIEGAGGVMAPLSEDATMIDLMAALGMPALLVAGSYLGTISHTLTAVHCLRQRGVALRAIVLNDNGGAPMPPEETAAVLARFLPEVPVALVARGGDVAALIPLLDD
jgi:dethiobiotin synthetase